MDGTLRYFEDCISSVIPQGKEKEKNKHCINVSVQQKSISLQNPLQKSMFQSAEMMFEFTSSWSKNRRGIMKKEEEEQP